MGPQALQQYMNADEAIKRLAAAQGIDVLNLVKSVDEMQQEQKQAQAMQMTQGLMEQAGQFANSPMMDPSKNPQAQESMDQLAGQMTVSYTHLTLPTNREV